MGSKGYVRSDVWMSHKIDADLRSAGGLAFHSSFSLFSKLLAFKVDKILTTWSRHSCLLSHLLKATNKTLYA